MGGMGKVYKAIDVNSKTVVAVKVINPEILKSDENKKRITDEGRILTSLNHPNIVRVFEIGETEETGYVAMEYLPGGTLYEYIKNNSPLPFETIKEYLLQICSGLEEIHSKNIIHRDLKSSNIMIDKNGIIRIMDFGLSKSPLIATMTSLGTALGTLGYVAPEQITNSNVDNRTDIFSLGVILYELITNDLPFKGENEIAMIHSIFNSNPLNPCELNPHIPNFVGEIVLKCIDKNSENRYSSVTGIINDINNN
jgi:serine/threonine-protein kinase